MTTTRYLGAYPITTTTSFNSIGNVIAQTDANGHTTTTEFNVLGQTTATVDVEGRRTEYEYDDLGRQTAQFRNVTVDGIATESANIRTETVYDVRGNVAETIDPYARVATHIDFDVLGRPITVTNGLNEVSTRSYNVLGQTARETNGLDETIIYSYDGLNRQTTFTYVADSITTSYI